jgi:hypothetical protein
MSAYDPKRTLPNSQQDGLTGYDPPDEVIETACFSLRRSVGRCVTGGGERIA